MNSLSPISFSHAACAGQDPWGEKDRWKASYFLLQQNLDSEIIKLVIMIGEVGGVGKQSPHPLFIILDQPLVWSGNVHEYPVFTFSFNAMRYEVPTKEAFATGWAIAIALISIKEKLT